jgi:eukaryotic-like serine/threonine-protein kinase
VTETDFTSRVSTRTRTVQAWPAVEARSGDVSSAPSAPTGPLNTAQLPDCGETVGGHCVLRALLGEGAFGRVFAAEDEETGQQVALKVVGLRRYPREYAEHELRALAAIAHPNVVQLNEHGVEASASEPYLWYTMPLYRGSDLAATLKAQGNLSLARAHAVFTRIAGGVCEMHNLGLRHQDIKPDNIYLANMAGVADHHPVLLDLGGAARERTNRPLVATFPFAAPEQCEALIGGLLGDQHPPVTEKVDVYALAGTLLFALIGAKFAGHDIAQGDTERGAAPARLLELREQLAAVHAARAEQPLPVGALPYVTGAARERLSAAFRRWLALDPLHRPSARAFVEELDVLLEWDAEVQRNQAKRELRSTLLGVAGALSLAACVGGLVGYQWHKRTMGEAKQATSAALRRADQASDELNRASSTLDKIVADPSLGPVDKARKITEVVESLEAQTTSLVAVNAQLQRDEKAAANQARARSQQERITFDALIAKAQTDLDTARSDQAIAEAARWKAESERDQARIDQALSDSARAKAERDKAKAEQDQASADAARVKAEAERDQSQQAKLAADAAKQQAEAERDRALQSKAAEVSAAFAKGVEAGSARTAPAPTSTSTSTSTPK